MVNILFWNIGRKPLKKAVVSLAHQNEVDILILAESEIPNDDLLQGLNENNDSFYYPDPGYADKLQILTRYKDTILSPLRDRGGVAVRRFAPPAGHDILIVGVHLSSKLYLADQDQSFHCARLNEVIDEIEREVGHNRTILIGDLNMNPYEAGIVIASGLNAVCDMRIAKRGSRIVDGKRYKYFYNPMWNFFGDLYPRPPGTYYYDSGKPLNYYWNIFDQVLVRPDLISAFLTDRLRIITEYDGRSLINQNRQPNRHKASDHLPVFLSLNV